MHLSMRVQVGGLNSDIELDLDGAKCSGSVAELLRSIKSRRTTLVIWLI
jgi:hypothetical protein